MSTVVEFVLIAFDLALLLLLTLRLTRLVTTDTILDPFREWVDSRRPKQQQDDPADLTIRNRYEWLHGLISCPFCSGFWLGVLTLISLATAGGPGDAADWWRWAAAPFALNYLVGHISAYRD